jgi:hypothetical protein
LLVVGLCLLAACAGHKKDPPEPERSPELLRCFLLTPEDFSRGESMDRRRPYREYLDWLIRTEGAELGLRADDVRLFASYAPAPARPGREGPVAGEIDCPPEQAWAALGRYRIVLYREALLGLDVSHLYNTIAHELKHVLQDLDDAEVVNCGRIERLSKLRKYERQAARWAAEIAPVTDCGTRNR